jgi:hypothetical protein
MTQSFLRLVGNNKPATIINVSSAGGISIMPHTSNYSLSKLVQIQMQRFVAVENPNITAISLHPGTILTGITKPQFVKFSKDSFALAEGVATLLATEQAKSMNGRYMGVNCSVAEFMKRKDEIVSKGLLVKNSKELSGRPSSRIAGSEGMYSRVQKFSALWEEKVQRMFLDLIFLSLNIIILNTGQPTLFKPGGRSPGANHGDCLMNFRAAKFSSSYSSLQVPMETRCVVRELGSCGFSRNLLSNPRHSITDPLGGLLHWPQIAVV